VKSAPAYRHGVLYVGDYGGYMNAVRASDGKLIWQSGSLGPGFAASGEFYSTPAVAFGRVYAGNNDGRVYSYDQSDGTLAWSHSTGGYVYSGPTVATTPTTPPTVYVGSFDGNIYALDAQNGETRWAHSAGGEVVGSLSAIGNIVYVAEFTNGSTNGYDMKTGKQVFHYKTGTYTPVISDGRRIYLVGYSSINALQPVHPKTKVLPARTARPAPRPAAHHRRAHRSRARAGARERGGGHGSGSG
jgi:glucose dehydrogenase